MDSIKVPEWYGQLKGIKPNKSGQYFAPVKSKEEKPKKPKKAKK